MSSRSTRFYDEAQTIAASILLFLEKKLHFYPVFLTHDHNDESQET